MIDIQPASLSQLNAQEADLAMIAGYPADARKPHPAMRSQEPVQGTVQKAGQVRTVRDVSEKQIVFQLFYCV